jgi:hypothetical protein
VSNNYLANLQYEFLTIADGRVELISQLIKGIRTVKCRILEQFYAEKVDAIRAKELASFSLYCHIKNICSSIYFNAGVIISAMIFMIVDKSTLDLGKVFSTLALLGYIFNFSICYSNYAIESLYTLKVFNQRIEDVITGPIEKDVQPDHSPLEPTNTDDTTVLQFEKVTASWYTGE